MLHPTHVLVEVRDADGRPPVRRGASRGDESGRGIHLVATVSEHWGSHLTPGGKLVWAVLPRWV